MIAEKRLYTLPYFQVILGAMLTMTGVSMQFHFGEFVSSIGHDVDTLGWIVGVGFVGSFLLRPHIGHWIDSLGCRPCFIAGALGAAAANFLFQFTENIWLISGLRMAMCAFNALYLTTVAVYAAHAAPPERRAESLGTVGIGGFMGMMIGPVMGDMVFADSGGTHSFALFFNIVAGCSLVAGIVIANIPANFDNRAHADRPSIFSLVCNHWPGWILVVSVAFSACLTIQMAFLERFADARSFKDISGFFLVYAPTAIAIRLLLRTVPQRYGRRRVCTVGLFLMAAGVFLIIPVRTNWQLALPAFLMGAGHSFVFPSMVDLVATAMPVRHRGLGTSVALAAMDVGFCAGGIVWGQLIDWKGFTVTFAAAGLFTASCAAWFYLSTALKRRASTP